MGKIIDSYSATLAYLGVVILVFIGVCIYYIIYSIEWFCTCGMISEWNKKL